jgi:DNA-binding SARP family transcriptional activator
MRIQICGPLAIARGSERLEPRLPGRQGRLLFVYLVMHRHREIPRDELLDVLWPESPLPVREAGLNPLLSKLRSILGTDTLTGRTSLRLTLPEAWVDFEAATEAIHRAESAIAQGDWIRAWGPSQVALFVSERDILAGEDLPWIDEIRRTLIDIRIRALDCYAATELGIGGAELAGAVRAGRQLIRLAPLRESGYRYVIEALAAQGNVAEALRLYAVLCEVLRDELGVSPSPATRQLYERLLAST